uniref:Uncharacterized protein n=1 Tax=Strongyloides papillosus TaxID=174720 RepID=A0A0N5BX69_STREA
MTKIVPKKLCSIFNNSIAFISKSSPLTTFKNSRYIFMISDIHNGERNLIISDTLNKKENKFKLMLIYGEITDVPLAIYIIDIENIILISAHYLEKSLHFEKIQIHHDKYYAEGIEAVEYDVPWIYSGYTFYDLQKNIFLISDGTFIQRYELSSETITFLEQKQEDIDRIIRRVKNYASRHNIHIPNGKRFILTNDYFYIILCSRSASNLNNFFVVSRNLKNGLQIEKRELIMNKKTKIFINSIHQSRNQINDYTVNEKRKTMWILSRYTRSQDSLMYIFLKIIRSVFEFLMIFSWLAKISYFFLSILKDEYSFALFCINLLSNEITLVEDFSSLDFYSPSYFSSPESISLLNTEEDTGNAILYKHKRKKNGEIYRVQNPYIFPSLKSIARDAAISQEISQNMSFQSIEDILIN